jgi:ketosteroid isomerase-like protein
MPVTSTPDLAEANKALVRQWFSLLNVGRLDEAAELSDPDGLIWSPRVRVDYPFRDWYPMYGSMIGERFSDGLSFELGPLTAEENRVSVLAEVRASKRDGSEYHNLYHFYFEADGRRITGAREYNDTLYASQAFA